jgi:hypothetical protein
MAPPPGSAYVVVRLESGATGIFPVTVAGVEPVIGAVTEPTFDIWPPSGEAIPPAGRPDAGPGAPAEVTDREAYPLCGEERVGVFDRRVGRTCFLGAVLDGRPAELASQEAGTGFDAVVVLYRFAGRGPVLVYRSATAAGPGWVRDDCAIGPAFDDEVIFVVGACLTTEFS